jgi:hypothetical protein
MELLQQKLEGTLRGTYRPMDNVPFFRVQYPPAQEREALAQFEALAERLRQREWDARTISIVDVLERALERLLNCAPSELSTELRQLEAERDRTELGRQLAEYLPDEMSDLLNEELGAIPREGVAILLRVGALYPLVRTSALESRLEGRVSCAIVLPYPGTSVGALLDAQPAGGHGGYYRGEILQWHEG